MPPPIPEQNSIEAQLKFPNSGVVSLPPRTNFPYFEKARMRRNTAVATPKTI